ncbi:VOC family protein [Candidatus Dependentiae bacterium]|nr:VOC family protein [Candidatus Dependentiae bacterium]
MKIKSISLGWISTSNLAEAKKFFQEDLGLKLTSDNEDMGWLELSSQGGEGITLGIADGSCEESPKPGSNTILTFTVDGKIEDAKKELEDRGVTFEGAIIEVPGHVKMVTFFDKDHNMFQLVEKLD